MGCLQHSKNIYIYFSVPSLFFSLSIPPPFFFSLWVAFGIQKKYTFQTLTSFLFSSAGCLPFFLTLSVVSAFFLTTFSCLPSFSHTLSVVSLFFPHTFSCLPFFLTLSVFSTLQVACSLFFLTHFPFLPPFLTHFQLSPHFFSHFPFLLFVQLPWVASSF